MSRRRKVEAPILSASGAHILTPGEVEVTDGALERRTDPWLAVAIVRVIGRAGDVGVSERELVELAEAEIARMSLGRLMAEGKLTESWNGSDFVYREVR